MQASWSFRDSKPFRQLEEPIFESHIGCIREPDPSGFLTRRVPLCQPAPSIDKWTSQPHPRLEISSHDHREKRYADELISTVRPKNLTIMLGVVSAILAILMLALPIASAVRLVVQRRAKVGQWLLWAGIVSGVCYVLMMLSVQTTEVHLGNKLDQFDLDGDGGFSGAEITPEMEKAMDDVTNDTGRTLAPITGLITCPIYSGFWHCVIGIPYLLISAHKQKRRGEQAGAQNP